MCPIRKSRRRLVEEPSQKGLGGSQPRNSIRYLLQEPANRSALSADPPKVAVVDLAPIY